MDFWRTRGRGPTEMTMEKRCWRPVLMSWSHQARGQSGGRECLLWAQTSSVCDGIEHGELVGHWGPAATDRHDPRPHGDGDAHAIHPYLRSCAQRRALAAPVGDPGEQRAGRKLDPQARQRPEASSRAVDSRRPRAGRGARRLARGLWRAEEQPLPPLPPACDVLPPSPLRVSPGQLSWTLGRAMVAIALRRRACPCRPHLQGWPGQLATTIAFVGPMRICT